jgi:adenosine deaminase CECR1
MKKSWCLVLFASRLLAADFSTQFEQIKQSSSKTELYAFLYGLPKGGDLHHHTGLSAFAETWYQLATSQKTLARNSFYTLTKLQNCAGDTDPQVHFQTIQRSTYENLDDCRKQQYQPLATLSADLKGAWLSSLKLDKPGEGRDEFFERIVPRFGDLSNDPYLVGDVIVENARLFGLEGVRYIETQIVLRGFKDATGKPIAMEDANRIICDRLLQKDAVATGVHVRFQAVIIRFLPDAELQLEQAYDFVSKHRDQWVGINMAGREDNDKGYALRFLSTYRRMRRAYSDIPLSIHGGEKDSPGHEVRDTLLIGATRIGHGVNLITDPDTMLLMRNNHYLVEINLVSNRVLGYVPDPADHPFPEYLRFGIPVCLNTDDRGSWDSDMTDEYYTAVTNYKLTWKEIVELGRNSLSYSFADPALKQAMLNEYEEKLSAFEKRFSGSDWKSTLAHVKPSVTGYAERTWGIYY